jgi:ABC-type sugar transport system substrate-binding protein
MRLLDRSLARRARTRVLLAFAVLAIASVAVTAGQARPQVTPAQRAAAAGAAAAAKLGSTTLPAGTTVGLNQIVGAFPQAKRIQDEFTAAAKAIGWKVVVCDAQGDPTKMANCETSLLNQGVKAIFSIGEESSLIAAGLQQAKAKHIPAFNIGGQVSPSPLFTGNYGPDESKAGAVLGAYVVKTIGPSGGKVLLSDYPALYGKLRTGGLKAAIKGTKLKIVATTQPDFANVVASTRQQVTSMYQQNPDAKVYWLSVEAALQPAAQALQAATGGKHYPNAPLIVSFHADLSTLALIRQGLVDAVSENQYPASAWVAVDSAAELMAGRKGTASPGYAVRGFPIYSYPIITKKNLPPAGKLVPLQYDYVSFFKAKWNKEFGVK